MTQNEIAAPLASALAERGYQTLTTVQQAVLNPEARGRDLLVSAQTGSGKTVAFGIAIADDLLDGDALPEAAAPLALAIAPTRELAMQVAAELRWLYAATGARIATCVGGMDQRTERRALERGAQIVVGTPGRLRDHIERGSLDLSALRAAVLDEADEMLDLGFREDLELILTAAPDSRRTLMFSATVPAAIEKLAQEFQRDALRVTAMGEARQHGDIAYRALSVALRDRENAIFNLLRYYEARTAIIFCKTRANVSHLLARMGNRGFRVVALSGELSQQERTHALQALRDGRARVCIATDVAARGIDLPGLELVIHADLPTNHETLLHRSGRTGRAGAKGVSALIVPPSEVKKAQRLLQGAKVVAEWGNAPSAEAVTARDDERMLDHPALTTPLEDMTTAAALLERVGPEQIAAAFVQLWREGRPAPEELSEVPAPGVSAPRAPREFGASVWFALSVGREGRAEPRWLLPKICEAGHITRDAIGAIRVRDTESFVQIAEADAPRFDTVREIAPGLTIRRIEGEPDFDRKPAPRTGGKPYAKSPAPRVRARDKAETPYAAKAPRSPVPEDYAAPKPPAQKPRAAEAPAPAAKPAYAKPPVKKAPPKAEAPAWSPLDASEAAADVPAGKKPRPAAKPAKSAKPKFGKPAAKFEARKPGKAAPKRPGKPKPTRASDAGTAPPRRPKGWR